MLCTYSRATRQKTAVLENCGNAVESEVLNGVSEFEFSMPANDAKIKYCKPFELIRWTDTGQLYRLLDGTEEITEQGAIVTYSAEHVIATLIDDVIFGNTQIDNLSTRESIENVLSRQSVKHWVLGDCEITRYFSYSWSNENLLVALFSIPDRFDEEYKWVFDTSVYPWRIHLKKLDQKINPEFYIRNARNLLSANLISKGREICTRLYALGYGEGINQLTFASINGGKPYIDASPEALAKLGFTKTDPPITRIWEDLRFEDPQSLLDRAKVLLKSYSQPYERYSVKVADIEKLTGEKYDRAEAGKIVLFGDYKTYITQVRRHLQDVGQDTLELANAPTDIASSIADLADRQRINSVYAQGATCLYSQAFNDNADPDHPATIRFYVPSEARQINKVILSWSFERFRSYSIGAESTVSTTKSTSAGGRTTSTSSSGGESNQTSSSGGGTSTSSSSGGGGSTTSGPSSRTSVISHILSFEQVDARDGGNLSPSSVSSKDHAHYSEVEVYIDHKHELDMLDHKHTVKIESHDHTVKIPSHKHTVEIPEHQHTVDIPGHTHATIYGIYEGPRATVASLKVDGANVPLVQGQREIDVAINLSVDGGGKIRRGTFHTIEIIPDSLTRISATISVQLFIQSEGGGLY